MSSPVEIWRRYDAIESRLSAGLSERMLDLAELQAGMRVLDLASGRGEPALRAARRVGADGQVWAVDQSEAMLAMARERAEREGLNNLHFAVGDAASTSAAPGAPFHAATMRWGLMYLDDPVAALKNARLLLMPGRPLVAAVWGRLEQVPFSSLPRRLLERRRELPGIDLDAPGMFRYGDLDRLVRDFREGGFRVDHTEEIEVPVFEAASAAAVVAWMRALGGGLGGLVNALRESEQRAWEGEMMDALEQTRRGGVIRCAGMTRIVRGRGPG